MKKNIIAGLDLGTTKVCVVIAEQVDENNFKILGFGVAPSVGLHKGLVSNISKTAEAIKEAYAIASNKAGLTITTVNVGVAGEHITSLRHMNYVTITNDEHEITKEDLVRLENDVRTIRIPSDRQILHIIPEEFFVDHQVQIDNPIGVTGSRLEAHNHIVLASVAAIQNIKKSVERAGLQVGNLVLQPLASCSSTLDEAEKDLGVLLIDIGGGTTDIAVIQRNAIKHTKVIGVAGNQVTNDIRESLGVVTDEAEKLKKNYGYATTSAIIKDEDIFIKGTGAKTDTRIPTTLLTQIISLRMHELFSIIDNEIRNAALKNKIKAGVVLTGGGSLLRGCAELAEEVFGLPTRIGVPIELTKGETAEIEKPEYSTAIGLLRGAPGANVPTTYQPIKVKKKKDKSGKSNKLKDIWNSFKQVLNEL